MTMMMSMPAAYVVKKQPPVRVLKDVPCTCGAMAYNDEKNSRQTKIRSVSQGQDSNSDANATSTGADRFPKRSLWRKMLGKGPKCVCKKLALLQPEPELIKIPSEYIGCKKVLVAGKRVPYTREMQQIMRKSWDPLEGIAEA
ncbi:hypothetical protein FI667_g9677, partial [Globisporangium splendens]